MYEIIKGFFFPIFFLWVLFTSRLIPKISDSILKIDPPNSLDIFINFFILISLIFLVLSVTLYIFKKKQNPIKKSNNYFVKSMFITSLVLVLQINKIWKSLWMGIRYFFRKSTFLHEAKYSFFF